MITWLKRIRGAVVMALLWAAGWGVAGLLIGVSSILLPWLPWDAFFSVFDAPLPALAVPGFFGGALFSVLLGFGEHKRRFEQLSVRRFAAWGALGGLLLTMIPASAVFVGSATITEGARGLWPLIVIIAVPLMSLSAASASGSLLLARRGQPRPLLDVGDDVADLWIADGEARELIGPSGT